MNRTAGRKTLLCFSLVILSSFSADAADIQLRRTCQCRGPLVRLGDVADVSDDNPLLVQSLSSVELFPAPARRRDLQIRELRELLALRGVNLVRCEFSGASTVAIYSETASARETQKVLTRAAAQRSRQRIENAILSYLRDNVDRNADWKIKTELSAENLRLIARAGSRLTVAGGEQPWVGKQNFQVSFATDSDDVALSVPSDVSLPAMVVVAVQSLRSGEIIRAGHVQLGPAPAQFQDRELVQQVDLVVGKEVVRSIAAGQPIDERSIQSPRLVRRGDIVTVYSRAAGIRLRTTAVAQEEGSLGDLIALQSLDRKHRYTARVSKFQEVEVFAGGPVVTSHRSN